jgi:toxin ParE1/3/4
MRILWHSRAEADLRDLSRYLQERDRGAAVRMRHVIRRQVRQLADHPNLGRSGRVAGTRELVITRTPYIVAYTIDLQVAAVVILRVLHGAQRWPPDL